MQRTLSPSKRGFVWEMKHNRTLYLMCVPALLLLLAFAYLPMGGIALRKENSSVNPESFRLVTYHSFSIRANSTVKLTSFFPHWSMALASASISLKSPSIRDV